MCHFESTREVNELLKVQLSFQSTLQTSQVTLKIYWESFQAISFHPIDSEVHTSLKNVFMTTLRKVLNTRKFKSKSDF